MIGLSHFCQVVSQVIGLIVLVEINKNGIILIVSEKKLSGLTINLHMP